MTKQSNTSNTSTLKSRNKRSERNPTLKQMQSTGHPEEAQYRRFLDVLEADKRMGRVICFKTGKVLDAGIDHE